MKVLVTGPEASGTRLLARLVTNLDVNVVHKSIPHGPDWPDVNALDCSHAVFIVRDWHATLQSQEAIGHLKYWPGYDPEERLRRSIISMFRFWGPWTYVTYEGLVARPVATMLWIADWLGVPRQPLSEDIFDANDKWLRI